MSRSVTVTGVGTATGRPDRVAIHLRVEVVRATAAEAIEAAGACIERVRTALASGADSGLEAESVDVSLHTDESWETDQATGRNIRRRNGFRANHSVTVQLGDLAILGSTLSTVLGAGGDDLALDRLELSVADPSTLRAQARGAAFAAARSAGEQHARLAESALGRVLKVVEAPAGAAVPVMRAMAATSDEAASLGVRPGSVEVSVAVTLRWELV